jgi:metal-responsive CopG/Arc/MetJ family transcriptional regulator
MGNKYVTIKLPRNLVDEIDKFVGKHGFVSRTEVVKEALRKLFQQYQLVKEARRSEDESET